MSTSVVPVGLVLQRVKVFVRVRPHLDDVTRACVTVAGDGGAPGLLLDKPSRQGDTSTARSYTLFDGVFDQEATQADVYQKMARPIVSDVLEGYNGTILAYVVS